MHNHGISYAPSQTSADASSRRSSGADGEAISPTGPEAARWELLPLHEFAVALAASDISTRSRGEWSREELAGWARQGMERLGAARVWWVAARTRQLRLAVAPAGVVRAEMRVLWGGSARAQRCMDLAWRHQWAREDAGLATYTPRTRSVMVPVVGQAGACLEYRVIERDEEMAPLAVALFGPVADDAGGQYGTARRAVAVTA